MIEKEPVLAENMDYDNTHVSKVLICGYILKILKLVFLIMTICYFIGLFWLIFCIEMYVIRNDFNSKADKDIYNTNMFVTEYNLIPRLYHGIYSKDGNYYDQS